MARSQSDLGRLLDDREWLQLPAFAGQAWSDDYSNILQAVHVCVVRLAGC
jgi:hypothetical protein